MGAGRPDARSGVESAKPALAIAVGSGRAGAPHRPGFDGLCGDRGQRECCAAAVKDSVTTTAAVTCPACSRAALSALARTVWLPEKTPSTPCQAGQPPPDDQALAA